MDRHRRDLRVPDLARRGRRGVLASALVLLGGSLLVGGGLLLGAGCGTSEPPGVGYELVGNIVESVGNGTDGPPIGGALVRFVGDTGRVEETTSQSNGRYRIFIVSDTRFGQLTASAPGFADARQTVYFDTPQRRVDLALPRVDAPSP